MKGKIIGKVLIILLAIVMVLPLSAFAASAEETPNTNAVPGYIQDIYRNGRTPEAQADYNGLKWQLQLESDISYVRNYVEEQEKLYTQNKSTKAKKEALESTKKAIDEIRTHIPSIMAIAKDAENGGDFDTAACIDGVVSSISTIVSFVEISGLPVGSVVSSVVDLGNAIFKLAMGGEAATSDLAQMEDRLNQQLDDIQNQISGIEEQISGLSDEINEATNTIVNEVTSAIDNADAKAELRRFMLSGEGNFSYNQYRNYFYGTIENNPKANTAYYSWLKESLSNGASDETVKYYYDKLYSSIMADMAAYYDYIVGSDNSKSIVQYYYDVVSARPNGTVNGLSAKDAAIMFAYDLYQTELMASQIIMSCNLYQYTYMYENGELVDVIDENGNVTGKKIAPLEIYHYDNDNAVNFAEVDGGMWEQLNNRINDIHDQLARDVAYILNLDDSYIVESADGDLFEIVNSDPDTYGKVLAGQTIYLNTIPEEICDLFGFDVNDFTYEISVPTNIDGAFPVDSNANRIEAALYYNGEEIDTMSFTVGTNAKFNGGNGTASDPYLIASAAQFARISDGLDKHYRLICDIDFNGATINPIGQKVNSNDAIVYDEFVGSLDGNGYTIKNLNVVGHTNAGLFGIVGETGEVADLKLYNVKVSANITNAERSTSEFYGGMIAGKNNGIIKYCSVDSDGTTTKVTVPNYDLTPEQLFTVPWTKEVDVPVYGLFLVVDNETRNRNIYAYAGGIAGANNYAVVGCTVENSHISASSTHDFGGDKTSTNKNNVYVGGVCGYSYGAIAHSIVKESVKISSYAKSIYNPETTVNPYVVVHAGGIAAKVNSLSDICQVESSAEIIRNDADLDCESKWGEHYKNCSDEKDTYIPKYSEDELKTIIATEDLDAFIAKTERNYTVTLDCSDAVYEAGSDAFNTPNLKFFINGVEKEYEIVDIYGFDTQNEKLESVPQNIVVLFSVEIEGEIVYFAQDITVTIKENVVTSIEILNLKDFYVQDTFSLEGLVIKYNYAVGNPEYVTINSENVSQVKFFGNITTFGTQSIALLYNGDTVAFEINVVCGHGNNFTSSTSGYAYDESLSKSPTCTEIGHNAYVCGTCGDIQYFYLRKTEHTPDYENAVGATDATCTEEGNTGKICCINCGETLIDGKVIPKLNHHYVYVDGDKHACSNGSHSEYHHYTVTESVELKINDDGSESWYIVYTYTCVCQKDGKVFAKEVVDKTRIVNANEKLPTIMVSDGYALSAGDEVVVYVQLLNNPGINAANFGIRYSEGLELISIQDGTVLKGSLVTDGLAVNYGYNFVWGNDNLFSNDGNLLKLTFKVSEYAVLGDSYDISLGYAIGNGAQGGFGTSAGKQYFITKDGTIKVVERLPGDINNDGVVDLMDAIEIGKFVVGKTDSIDETYANVDLSYNDEGNSNVDIMDMVAILQYITGGYGTNLLTQDFEIVLNTNGYDKVLNDLHVSIYGVNSTYDEAGLAELERQGYKFLGWYDQMFGGNLIDINGDVRYNPNQKKQTLYAHWEWNKLIFEANGATSGVMPDVYYIEDSNVIIENDYKKEYNVAFVSDNAQYSNTQDHLKYELLHWEGSNRKTYTTLDAAVKDLREAHYGSITLTAVWSETPTISYPEWMINGYETTVNWYIGTVFKTEINPGVNDATILNATVADGYYCVYAKHTPIVYDIVFDFNGGSGTVAGSSDNTTLYGHSVENTFNLSSVSVTNVGNAFTSWAVYVDDVYYKDFSTGETIGYLPNAKQDSLVTVKAIWNEKSYTIHYVLNGGNLSDGGKITTYRISEVDGMSIASPTYSTYSDYNTFVGWYVDKELTQEFDKATLKVNPENITLYAKWDLCTVYYITNTPQKITGNRVIVDWSSVSNGTYNSSRTIYTENVSQIYFVGNPDTIYDNLIISAYAGTATQANQMIHFTNFNMNGYLTKTDNSVNLNMTIDCSGNNAIKAPDETSAIVKFTSLTFTGAGSMSITGGNGVSATTAGGNGTAGATAIIVDNLTVNMTGTVTVFGGRGGNGAQGASDAQTGGNGGNGGNGITVTNLKVSSTGSYTVIAGEGGDGGNGGAQTSKPKQRSDGKGNARPSTGYTGYSGGAGGNGGNSGRCIVAVGIEVDSESKIILKEAESGAGGDGSKGGTGGTGGNSTWWAGNVQGGDGGTGGDGGDGGDAGIILNALLLAETIVTSPDSNIVIQTCIAQGGAGDGGDGGDGGSGGKNTNYHWYGSTGAAGETGADGSERIHE